MCAKKSRVCQEESCVPSRVVYAKKSRCAKNSRVCQEESCMPRIVVYAKKRSVCQEEPCVPRRVVYAKESHVCHATGRHAYPCERPLASVTC
eukprot:1141394-Pelagomonas_calceolata.AAC.1